MSPNYNFPSSRKIEIDLSNIEKPLRRARKARKARSRPLDLVDIFIGAALAAVIMGVIITLLLLSRGTEARAQEPLKTNADYCQEILEGKWTVIGATPAEVATYCGL